MEEFTKKLQAALDYLTNKQVSLTVEKIPYINSVYRYVGKLKTLNSSKEDIFFMDVYHALYVEGTPVIDITHELIKHHNDVILSTASSRNADEILSSFKIATPYIGFRLVNTELNKNRLEDIVHFTVTDDMTREMGIYLDNIKARDYFIPITNKAFDSWGITMEELFNLAEINMLNRFPVTYVINKSHCCFSRRADVLYKALMNAFDDCDIIHVTNTRKHFGATGLLYPGLMEHILLQLKRNIKSLHVLPVSLHDGLIIVDSGNIVPKVLDDFIVTAVESLIPKGHVLSKNAFHYSVT